MKGNSEGERCEGGQEGDGNAARARWRDVRERGSFAGIKGYFPGGRVSHCVNRLPLRLQRSGNGKQEPRRGPSSLRRWRRRLQRYRRRSSLVYHLAAPERPSRPLRRLVRRESKRLRTREIDCCRNGIAQSTMIRD